MCLQCPDCDGRGYLVNESVQGTQECGFCSGSGKCMELLKLSKEYSSWRDYSKLAWEMNSKAVVCMGMQDGFVLHTVGPALRHEMEEAGLHFLSDLGLDDAPEGISVWEGKYVWHRGGWENPDDGDSEAVGTFRELTEAEWDSVKKNECPWNEDEYKVKEKLGDGG